MSDDKKKEIKVTPYKDGSGAKIDVYSPDPRTEPHDSIHLKVNTNEGTFQSITKIDGNKETASGGCYLTTACMKHFEEEFDDAGYELTVLRWFRDNFVSKEDIKHYYEVAPIIVEAIDENPECDKIYDYIYDNVIDACVKAIEKEDYDFAYNRYKSSILAFEETYAKPMIGKRLVKAIKTI